MINYQKLYKTKFRQSENFALPRNSGLFVVFEGIDGSGKSSLIYALKKELTSRNFPVSSFSEPTKEGAGLELRKMFAAKNTKTKEALDNEINLFLEDRAANLQKNILPNLKENRIVLLDRYLFSSGAYQGRDYYSSYEVLEKNLQAGFPLPHLLFFLDTNVDTCLKRINKSRSSFDFFEQKEMLEDIEKRYKELLPENTFFLSEKMPRQSIIQKVLNKIIRTMKYRKK